MSEQHIQIPEGWLDPQFRGGEPPSVIPATLGVPTVPAGAGQCRRPAGVVQGAGEMAAPIPAPHVGTGELGPAMPGAGRELHGPPLGSATDAPIVCATAEWFHHLNSQDFDARLLPEGEWSSSEDEESFSPGLACSFLPEVSTGAVPADLHRVTTPPTSELVAAEILKLRFVAMASCVLTLFRIYTRSHRHVGLGLRKYEKSMLEKLAGLDRRLFEIFTEPEEGQVSDGSSDQWPPRWVVRWSAYLKRLVRLMEDFRAFICGHLLQTLLDSISSDWKREKAEKAVKDLKDDEGPEYGMDLGGFGVAAPTEVEGQVWRLGAELKYVAWKIDRVKGWAREAHSEGRDTVAANLEESLEDLRTLRDEMADGVTKLPVGNVHRLDKALAEALAVWKRKDSAILLLAFAKKTLGFFAAKTE